MGVRAFILVLSASFLVRSEIPISKVYDLLQEGGDARMRTMRILQEYAMIASNNHFQNPQKQMQEDLQRLSRDIERLLKLASTDDETKEAFRLQDLRQAQKSLLQAKAFLEEAPSAERALSFWEAMDKVRERLNRTLVHLSQMLYPDDEYLQGIMYANRLSTIAQRYGALYLYRTLGKGEPLHVKQQLVFLHDFFPDTIESVKESAQELPENLQKNALTQLKALERDLNYFYIMGRSSRRFIPTLIYQKADKIAARASGIAKLFVQSASGATKE